MKFDHEFYFELGSFFIEEEKKLAVVFDLEESKERTKHRFDNAAYVIGESGLCAPGVVLLKNILVFFNFLSDQKLGCTILLCSLYSLYLNSHQLSYMLKCVLL